MILKISRIRTDFLTIVLDALSTFSSGMVTSPEMQVGHLQDPALWEIC